MPEASEMVRIFCSYAREDADLLQAFLRAFSSLNELVAHNIVAISDKDIGAGNEIDATIEEKLQITDILLVLYTGIPKKPHSYTGWEIGYFQALMNQDIRSSSRTSRRIISFFLHDPPPVTSKVLGIKIGLDRQELELGRAEYLRQVLDALPEDVNGDETTKCLFEITQLAEERKPTALASGEQVRRGAERIQRIRTEVLPCLKGDIYDCISSRIVVREVEQLLIKFELPKQSVSSAREGVVPDETELSYRGNAGPGTAFGTLFGGTEEAARRSWAEFKVLVKRLDEPYGTVLYAIEQALESAIQIGRGVDNDQVIRSPADGKLYRVIVTEQIEYYDGRRTVYLWLIPFLSFRRFGNPDTSLLLSFIVLAAKYRFLFLEEDSLYAIEKVKAIADWIDLKETVISILRELVLIEEESRALELDGAEALLVIVPENIDKKVVAQHMAGYKKTREALERCANVLIALDPSAPAYDQSLAGWWAALDEFLSTSRTVNSTYATSALENLRSRFAEDHHESLQRSDR